MGSDKPTPPEIPEPRRTPWRDSADLGEMKFHYQRAEREAMHHRVWEPPTGGFFRRNRALSLVILDVSIVVILFLIYLFFLRPLEGEYRVGDYRFRLEAFVFEEELLLAADVRAPSRAERQPVMTFSAAGEVIQDLAPRSGGQRRIGVRLPLAVLSADGTISVTLEIEGESRTVNHRALPE